MFEQFEDMILNPLIQKLNTHGININEDTIKKALTNSPQVVTQIESILTSTSTSQEKIEKIKTLITQATQGETSKTTTTSTK